MIMVQKFHSIHEIDPEFIPNLETLLQEEIINFNTLIERHDSAPASDVFTYFLFFGPTQNAPIGFAQLCLRTIPHENIRSWSDKLKFWNKDHLHWKEAIWKVGDGNLGYIALDPKFSRSVKEKMTSLMKEQEDRPEIMAEAAYCLKGLQEFHSKWETTNKWTREQFVLEPLFKTHKSYADYINVLTPEVAELIKANWKKLHKESKVVLGDYPSMQELPRDLQLPEKISSQIKRSHAQILTFEKDGNVLGCLCVFKGKGGNVFIEPFPLEPANQAVVADDLYIQYAILKFYEMNDAKKCHIIKDGKKLLFEEKEDLKFFQEQGFIHRTIVLTFASKLPKFSRPI